MGQSTQQAEWQSEHCLTSLPKRTVGMDDDPLGHWGTGAGMLVIHTSIDVSLGNVARMVGMRPDTRVAQTCRLRRLGSEPSASGSAVVLVRSVMVVVSERRTRERGRGGGVCVCVCVCVLVKRCV